MGPDLVAAGCPLAASWMSCSGRACECELLGGDEPGEVVLDGFDDEVVDGEVTLLSGPDEFVVELLGEADRGGGPGLWGLGDGHELHRSSSQRRSGGNLRARHRDASRSARDVSTTHRDVRMSWDFALEWHPRLVPHT